LRFNITELHFQNQAGPIPAAGTEGNSKNTIREQREETPVCADPGAAKGGSYPRSGAASKMLIYGTVPLPSCAYTVNTLNVTKEFHLVSLFLLPMNWLPMNWNQAELHISGLTP